MTHIPTGIKAKSATRSQHENRKFAKEVLEARVANHYDTIKIDSTNKLRKEQIGSGMRGDKIRTYREKDDIATDHRQENKVKLSFILRGELERFVI